MKEWAIHNKLMYRHAMTQHSILGTSLLCSDQGKLVGTALLSGLHTIVSVCTFGIQFGDNLSGSGLTMRDWRFSGKSGQVPN